MSRWNTRDGSPIAPSPDRQPYSLGRCRLSWAIWRLFRYPFKAAAVALWVREVRRIREWSVISTCRLLRRPVIYVVGDSHTQLLHGVWPFIVRHIGPATAFNLMSPFSSTDSWAKVEHALSPVNAKRDIALLVFGEIDCRIHAYRQYVRSAGSRTMEEIVTTTIERYGEAIRRLRKKGYSIVVQNVVGAAHQDNIYGYSEYADIVTRGHIARLFNRQLAAWCAINGISCLDVHSKVTDKDGVLVQSMTMDGTHLDQRALPVYRQLLQGLSLL